MSEAPFKVGQRVRMTANGRQRFPALTSYIGTVKTLQTYPPYFAVRVHRDGLKRLDLTWWTTDFWEPIPLGDLTLDETAVLLARAVLAGDNSAALPLADRVVELIGK